MDEFFFQQISKFPGVVHDMEYPHSLPPPPPPLPTRKSEGGHHSCDWLLLVNRPRPFAFAARTCIVVVVVTNESNMASYFSEAGNLNGSNADMCSDVAGPSSSGPGDLFDFSDRSNDKIILLFPPLLALLAAILDLSVTATLIPHNAFGACYVIMQSLLISMEQ